MGQEKKFPSIKMNLGKGPKKCKTVVFYQSGGGSAKTKPLFENIFFLKLNICPQTCPIHKEIVDLAVLVINFLCSDHFLIA